MLLEGLECPKWTKSSSERTSPDGRRKFVYKHIPTDWGSESILRLAIEGKETPRDSIFVLTKLWNKQTNRVDYSMDVSAIDTKKKLHRIRYSLIGEEANDQGIFVGQKQADIELDHSLQGQELGNDFYEYESLGDKIDFGIAASDFINAASKPDLQESYKKPIVISPEETIILDTMPEDGVTTVLTKEQDALIKKINSF